MQEPTFPRNLFLQINLLSRNNGPFQTLRLVPHYLNNMVVMTTGYKVWFQNLNLNMLQSPWDTPFKRKSKKACACAHNTICQKPQEKGPPPFTHTQCLRIGVILCRSLPAFDWPFFVQLAFTEQLLCAQPRRRTPGGLIAYIRENGRLKIRIERKKRKA